MMRLSMLWRVDATIRDDGSSPVAERILERWEYDRGSLRFCRSSANFTYRFQQQHAGRYLRFAAASERRREVVESEMEIVRTLAAAGLDVAAAIPSRQGRAVETVETDWGDFYAVALPALDGQQYECEDLDESGFRQWGAALGQLHAATRTLAASPAVAGRPTWRDHLSFISGYLPADSLGLRREYDDIAETLDTLPITPDSFGLIHGDFELDNLIWQGTRIGIVDFDDCARMWYAADIAFALRDVASTTPETVILHDGRCRAFVAGYREHHPLDENSLSRVPLFLRFTGLLHYARMVRATDLVDASDYPEWLIGLNRKLLQRMADYRAAVETHWQ